MCGTNLIGDPWLVNLITILNATAILQYTAAFLQANGLSISWLAGGTLIAGFIVDCASNAFAAQLWPPAPLRISANPKTLVVVLVVILATIAIELAIVAIHVAVHLHWLLHWASVKSCFFLVV